MINSATQEEKKAGVEEQKKLGKYADDSGSIALERLFHFLGYQAIIQVKTFNVDGQETIYSWEDIASEAKWLANGRIAIKNESKNLNKLFVEPDPIVDSKEFSIVDLAPAILSSLSLPELADARSPALSFPKTTHVVLVILDAFGYLDVQKALQQGLIPHLMELGEAKKGLTVYPAVTNVVTAALLTGVEPEINGVDQSNKRSTKTTTLFDQLCQEQKSFAVIEGYSLYLANLKAEDLVLSNDENKNGTNDDEVFGYAITKIRKEMPEFLWVHFHGIDDAGHTFSPWSSEYVQRVKDIDGYIQQIVDACPANTLVLLTADHGMHPNPNNEGQRTGEHGNLIAEDMLIPLFSYLKPEEAK